MAEKTREDWLKYLAGMPQPEKDNALFLCIDGLHYEQVEDLIKAGAKTKYPHAEQNDVLAWAVRRTDDWRMVNLLLNLGLTAEHIRFKDLEGYLQEDSVAGTKLLTRLAHAGMPVVEKALAMIYASKEKESDLFNALLTPGEDPVALIKTAKREDRNGVLQSPDIARQIEVFYQRSQEIEAELYDKHFAGGLTAEKLAATVTDHGMTGLMLAIRTGHTDAAFDYYRAHAEAAVPLDLVLQTDDFHQSAPGLLWHRQELDKLFDPRLWCYQIKQQRELWDRIPENYKAQCNFETRATEARQLRLKMNAPPPALKKNPSLTKD